MNPQVLGCFDALLARDGDAMHDIAQVEPVGEQLWIVGSRWSAGAAGGPSGAVWRLDGEGLRLQAPGVRLVAGSQQRGLIALVSSDAEGRDRIDWMALADLSPVARWQAPGRIEQLAWSPDGARLLLLIAGPDADVSGREGGYSLRGVGKRPAQAPLAFSSSGQDAWRRLWIWESPGEPPRVVSRPPLNPWEACWAGARTIAVIASDGASESDWFGATLRLFSPDDGGCRRLHRAADAMGGVVASGDGRALAWIEALASDRGLVCGAVRLILDGAAVRTLEVSGIQATQLAWRDQRTLVVAGLRGLQTVVADVHLDSGRVVEHFAATDQATAGWFPSAAVAAAGGVLVVTEAYARPPRLEAWREGVPRVLLETGPTAAAAIGRMRSLRWPGDDGVEIEGLLIEPPETLARPPTGWPLYVDIHGGPVYAHRARWAFRLRADALLARAGCAVLLPNPRGSAGRGDGFARAVLGDMGGCDLRDLLAGVDHLVSGGVVDPSRVAAGGTSYGGYLAAALVTQTRRLAAAVPISPVTNWYHQHYASQAPWFDRAFLAASPVEPGGPYHARSPVFHAAGATTPTLTMAGARDKNAPPGQALEFHNALAAAGATSTLLLYPEGGHSLRGHPEYIDSAARILDWMQRYVLGPAPC